MLASVYKGQFLYVFLNFKDFTFSNLFLFLHFQILLLIGLALVAVRFMFEDANKMPLENKMYWSSKSGYLKSDSQIKPKDMSLVRHSASNSHITKTGDAALIAELPENYWTNLDIPCEERRYLVYKCHNFCGGLGDRQKGIITAFLFSKLSNRSFVVDVDNPCEWEEAFLPNRYDWTRCKRYALNVDNSENQLVRLMGAGNKAEKMFGNMNYSEQWTKKVVTISLNWYGIDAVRKYVESNKLESMQWIVPLSNEQVVHELMNVLFRPVDKLTKEVDDFLNEQASGKSLACSHIRVGKNPSIPNDTDFKRFRGYPNISTIFSFLSKYSDANKYKLYIASDSAEVRNQAFSVFNNMISFNKTILHVDKAKRGNAACSGYYDAVAEQLLLTRCDSLLLTKSNFGSIAALVGGNINTIDLYQTGDDKIVTVKLWDLFSVYHFV